MPLRATCWPGRPWWRRSRTRSSQPRDRWWSGCWRRSRRATRPAETAAAASRPRSIIRQTGGGYGGNNDLLIDLRIDDHPDPVTELQRLYAIQNLLFGRTPEDQLIPIEQVHAELSDLLERVGYGGDIDAGLRTWAGMENLEERLSPGRIDPVVLGVMRERAAG